MQRQEKIAQMILDCLKELNQDLQIDELRDPRLDTRLYGSKSGIDSLSLVSLIADLEEKVAETFGVNVILADDRAMSQKTSPFRRVATLAEYTDKLIAEQEAE